MKSVLVTGSEGGLGRALCAEFREAGYRVLGLDLHSSPTLAQYEFLQLDLAALTRDQASWETGAAQVHSWVGARLDVLVNNAAVQRLGELGAVTAADWHETVTVNLTAPLWLAQALAGALSATGGVVVNVGSVHAHVSKPGFLAYAVSKAGLSGLTRALALEMAPRVRVVGVAPAAIDTAMLAAGFADREPERQRLAAHHPLGRIATAEEVARVVRWLASSEASFITGTTVAVDGGILSRLHDPT